MNADTVAPFRTDSYARLLVNHAGILGSQDALRALVAGRQAWLNGERLDPAATPRRGDHIELSGRRYAVIAGGSEARLQVEALDLPQSYATPVRVHCGYHKGLTELSKKIYRRSCRPPLQRGGSFRHFYHRLDAFYQHCGQHSLCSLSGQAIDLARFADIRVLRVVRDPRDLLVSGYHYHRRAAEHWCTLPDPKAVDWAIVNGAVPQGLGRSESLSAYLRRVPAEQGLLAELELRRPHFESMRAWPGDDERVRVLRYEDIIGHEAAAFGEALAFLGLSWLARLAGRYYARRYSAKARGGKQGHIRDPRAQQWREQFTPAVHAAFMDRYSDLLERYGYSPD